ncbi:Uncharacterized protein TPAR_01386 [Tolypocladium paradoxum]|uniref:Uncharacterized protein n=1 Tax=Tolypocladium paradoxum TaxID=94208 RepID=A0A2S4L7I8_9HYPO|nr:Uncharacterized protein TPAR_01386 [Tolypocladium paradoxum]
MTEPENFEEDLFADLYDDNDASKTGPGPQAAAPAVEAPKVENDSAAPAAHEPAQPADDEHMQQDADEDDDDDEVDFNLGGGGSSTAIPPPVQHDDAPSTPPYGTVHKASAKDDG